MLFAPFTDKQAKKLSRPLLGVGEIVQKFFPGFTLILEQSGLNLNPDAFFAMTLFTSAFYAIATSILMIILLIILKLTQYMYLAEMLGLIMGMMVFVKILGGASITIVRNVRSINSNLIFGLKMILVEINAGVGLFDAVVIVAMHNLGEMSNVFKDIAKRLNSGEAEEEVLKDIATKNPSPFLRKVLWQIISGLKAGSPLNKVIDESLSALEREQKIEIIAYGSSLRVLTLMFMMIGVIIPSMGLTFIFVLNSLPGINITNQMLWTFLAIIALFQFMLIGYIKSKRPMLMGSV
ncbi:MAG: type II secretion system F family protein [archaeon]